MSLVDFDLDQPRRHVDPEHLAELVESMDANGLVQPVLLRPVDGRLLVVAGERRVRAAHVLGWNTIPAVVRDVDPADVPWTQLVENLQRADLSPVEEAAAYKRLVDAGHSHAAVGSARPSPTCPRSFAFWTFPALWSSTSTATCSAKATSGNFSG